MTAWGGTVSFQSSSYYNSADLTRENNNIAYLKEQLALVGYAITLPSPTTSATRLNFPLVTNINNTKRNIQALISGFYPPVGAPAIVVNTARKQKFDHIEANKLELNLQGLYEVLKGLVASYRFCGTFACGEGDIV